MPGNPQMRTCSQTTLTIRTDKQTDGRTDGRTNGRTDKNRQTIAVTLRLGFAARVNKPYHALQVGHTRATDNYMYNFQRGDTVVM